MWKLIHRVHQRARFNKEGCCFCMTSPEVGIESATQQALLRAASREAELNEGTKKLAQSYTKSEGVWYSHSRLEKEGPIEVRDVDSLPFYDVADIKKILPIVLTKSPLFKAHLSYVHEQADQPRRGREHPQGDQGDVAPNRRTRASQRPVLQKGVYELPQAA
jgi:hypothetical protein